MRAPPADIVRRASYVLEHWQDFPWTVQGFGMVRTYLDDAQRWRLNVWDDRLKVPNVSEIHDHPWDFRSWVLCGRLTNVRFLESQAADKGAVPFQHVEIVTGEGGGPVMGVVTRHLVAVRPEGYEPGDTYTQRRQEIHVTKCERGTVTLNDRGEPTPEHTARIYWAAGPWINAEPRAATHDEVRDAIVAAQRQAEFLRLL